MEEYFQQVAETVSIDDLTILGILYDEGCFLRAKAMSNSQLFYKSKLTEAIYRKVMGKLIAIKFIEAHTQSKTHAYFLNEFGQEAIMLVFQNDSGG